MSKLDFAANEKKKKLFFFNTAPITNFYKIGALLQEKVSQISWRKSM